MFVGVSYHPGHARQGSQFFWSALRIATGYQDATLRMVAADAADGGAGVPVGRGCHCAGVEDDNFGLPQRGSATEALCPQLLFNRGAIGLRRAASKILYVETAHASILT